MIIEFYGLPGTGKTSIVKNLVIQGQGEGIEINNMLWRIYYSLIFLLKQPQAFFSLFNLTTTELRFCNSHKLFSLYIHRLKLLIDKASKYGYAYKNSSAEALFIDEGFFQYILSMCEKEKTIEEMIELIDIIPKPDILIILSRHESLLEGVNQVREKKRRDGNLVMFGSEYAERKIRVITWNDRIINEVLSKEIVGGGYYGRKSKRDC